MKYRNYRLNQSRAQRGDWSFLIPSPEIFVHLVKSYKMNINKFLVRFLKFFGYLSVKRIALKIYTV